MTQSLSCAITFNMPTKEWMRERRLQTFWLTEAEEAVFSKACKKKGITKAEALREMAVVMLSTVEAQDA